MREKFVLFSLLCCSIFTHAQDNKLELLRSKETKEHVWVVAHRADYVYAPENSIETLNNAIYFGSDIIETDVRQIIDGHIVIMHDYTVDRTTNGTGRVSDLTLEEIKKLRLKTSRGGSTTFQVPTLEEYIQVAKGKVGLCSMTS